MKIKIYFIVIVWLLQSCNFNSSNNNSSNVDSKVLNNKAMDKYAKIMFKPLHESKPELIEILEMLNQAIEIDNDYVLAYTNKANVLVKLQRYDDAIKVLEKASNLKDDYAEVISIQGFYYEKIGKLALAENKYNEALIAYDNRIKKSNKIEDLVARAFLLAFTENKQTALEEINQLQKEHPKNKLIINMKHTIEYFDRSTYINNH